MAFHERKQLRDAIVAQLIAAATSAGSRVFATRLAPVPEAQLPAISVYTDDETVDPASANTAPRELKRTVLVRVDCWVAGAPLDDGLDAIALEVETAMDGDCEFDQTAFSSIMTGTEFGMKMEGSRPMGVVSLTYSCVYNTFLRVDDPTDDFDTADIRFSLEGEQAALDQANDLLEDIHE